MDRAEIAFVGHDRGGRGTLAPMMASGTCGGPDLKTVCLGSPMGPRLPSFHSPVPGLPLPHWHA